MPAEGEKGHFEISNPCTILFGAGATRGAFADRSLPPPVDKDFFEIAGQIEGRGTRAVARKVLKSVLGAPALDKRDGTSKSPSRSRARRVDLLRRPGTPRGLRPRWLDASRGSAARDYAPALRSPWRAAWELYGRTNNVGLEEYYREVETRARIGSFAKSQNQPRDWDRRKKDLEELIRRVYIHTTVDMTQSPPQPLKSPVHQQLLKRLRTGGTIITFNYDLVIEESFETAELWNPRDGFAITVTGISHDWTRHWAESRDVNSLGKSGVHLLKLHGSLGWVQYANRQVRLKNRPYVVRKGATEKISVCPPGWNKPIDRNPYKALWREARLKLESCKSLVIVGYSLPETDLLAKALFSEVVRMRSAREKYLSQLVLVDPSDVVKERFTSLFTPALGAYWTAPLELEIRSA